MERYIGKVYGKIRKGMEKYMERYGKIRYGKVKVR